MGRIILNIGLEHLSNDAAIKKGLVSIGEPTIAKNPFELTGFGGDCLVEVNSNYIPKGAVAYSTGNPAIENASKGGLNVYVPIQFFMRKE